MRTTQHSNLGVMGGGRTSGGRWVEMAYIEMFQPEPMNLVVLPTLLSDCLLLFPPASSFLSHTLLHVHNALTDIVHESTTTYICQASHKHLPSSLFHAYSIIVFRFPYPSKKKQIISHGQQNRTCTKQQQRCLWRCYHHCLYSKVSKATTPLQEKETPACQVAATSASSVRQGCGIPIC